MLNDADGHGADAASDAVNDAEALFRRLKRDVKADYNSKGQVNWRKEAREDFDFDAGEQLNEIDLDGREASDRQLNRVGTTVDSVAGQEVGNRRYGAPLLTRIVCSKYPDLFQNRKLAEAPGDVWTPRNQPPPRGGVGHRGSQPKANLLTFPSK